MRRIIARTKLTFVSSLSQDSVLFLTRPRPLPLSVRGRLLAPFSPGCLGFTRELTQSGHDNASLEKCAFGDTTQQVSTECPDTDLQILRFYRGTTFSRVHLRPWLILPFRHFALQ